MQEMKKNLIEAYEISKKRIEIMSNYNEYILKKEIN